MSEANQPLFAVTELINAYLLSDLNAEKTQKFIASPADFMKDNFDVNLPEGFSVEVTLNTVKEINLALPYYNALEGNVSKPLSDDDMKKVIGGVKPWWEGLHPDDPPYNDLFPQRVGVYEKG